MKTVKLVNPATGITQVLPVAELAPNVIAATGPDGQPVFVPSEQIKANTRPIHPPFPEDARKVVQRIQSALADVDSSTVEEWEHTFRCDCDPDREIRVWLWIADMYSELVSEQQCSVARRRDFHRLCLRWTMCNDLEAVLATTQLDEITPRQAKAIIPRFLRRPSYSQTMFVGNPLKNSDMPIWGFELVGNPVRFKQLAKKSDIIIAVDERSNFCRNDGHCGIAYGQDVLQAIMDSDEPMPTRLTMFALDFHFEAEVYRFLAAVEKTTGYLGLDFTIRDELTVPIEPLSRRKF